MLTPLLMVLILVLPALAARLLEGDKHDPQAWAARGLGLLFCFTASGHFLQAQAMAQMLPPWVPMRGELVLLTGLLEIAIGLALFVPRARRAAAWAAGIVLVAFFPANIYAAWAQVPFGGHAWGPLYLLVRAPLQAFILWWIWKKVLSAGRH